MLNFGGCTEEYFAGGELGLDLGFGAGFEGSMLEFTYARYWSLLIHASTSTSLPLMLRFDPGNRGAEKAIRPMLFPTLLNRVA